ncbi:hypothetical protein TNCV_3618961 [Trichonephila clavipes]|nr:hypothetical protein TNCV_3618961 [Trichonephila clavipes]
MSNVKKVMYAIFFRSKELIKAIKLKGQKTVTSKSLQHYFSKTKSNCNIKTTFDNRLRRNKVAKELTSAEGLNALKKRIANRGRTEGIQFCPEHPSEVDTQGIFFHALLSYDMAAVVFLYQENPLTWAGVESATLSTEDQRQTSYATQSSLF